ncbi:DegT/DnrJ/EryC1/StrS family aminotransferase [Camelimonas abortus]|uniref:DegT/DnrJ/EryC1/StrS family aminotransferase n=1 Tax=Camelimonas abortus TaxID=1017184 RepID=A0ABV7LHB5_9HYPH
MAELEEIENSGIFSNYGPVNTRLEAALTRSLFGNLGGCLTVNNATTGLMLAIRDVMKAPYDSRRRYALMPSFTFAATAHAAIWAGLVPLLCDIDPETWLPCVRSEEELLQKYKDQIDVIIPYATFGNCLDLTRYDMLSNKYDVGIVVDAAASLGSKTETGAGFGEGFRWPVVFSMHATKTFATAEAGLIYCSDPDRLARLRVMGNFGFGEPRTATMPGLNSKLSEIGALLGLAKLEEFEDVISAREALARTYINNLPDFVFQRLTGNRVAYQFMPALLPKRLERHREALFDKLSAAGIGAAQYFNPHIAEQPYFARLSAVGDLTVTADISRRIVCLPLSDDLTEREVLHVCAVIRSFMEDRR